MLILATTSDKLRLLTTAAGSIDVHASWMDNVAGAVNPGRTNTPSITTATTTDIVASPGSGNFRNIKTLHVHNRGTVLNTVAVLHSDGTTQVELHRALLMPGATLQYIDEVGFSIVGAGEEAGRQLLKTIVPTAVNFFDIGPDILQDPRFSRFDIEYQLKHSNTVTEAICVRGSVDNGATFYAAAGGYHYSGYFACTGSPASNGFTASNAATLSIWNIVVAPNTAAVAHVKLYTKGSGPGNPGWGYLHFHESWGWDNSVPYYHTTFSGSGGMYLGPSCTNIRMFLINGSNFVAGYGYLRVYGVK